MRFPEFEGEWNITTLGDCSHSLDYGMNAAATAFDGENRYIRITDIDQDSSKYKPETPVSPLGELSDKYLVKENDILFARTGASTGKTYLYDKDDGALYFAGFLIRANISKTNSAKFIFAQTQTVSYDRWVKLMSMRSGQPGINSQEYASYQFLIPTKTEQDRIANLLTLIDRRIQTQNKIIEKLETLIKGLSNSLFSQNVRFPEFEEKWRTYKISDLLMFFSTNSLAWEQLEYSRIGFYNLHYGLIHHGLPLHVDLTHYILPIIKSKSIPTNYEICQNGDIAFADASEDTDDVGKVVEFINCNNQKAVCGLHTIHGRDKLDVTILGFKGFAFSSKLFRDQIKKLAQGTKVYSISSKALNVCLLDIPSKDEQLKIVKLLTGINRKITTEKKILQLFECQKKYLLKKVFI